jgi:hypothetical protein
MQMQVTDAWGNSYSFPQFSTIYREVVGVPDYKMLNAGVAATAFGVALGAAAGGAISGPFTFGIGAAIGGGVAATAMAVATGFCNAAQDPPVPDLNYNEVASVIMPPVPKAELGGELQNTLSLLLEVVKHLAISSAMSATQGKLLAAKQQANNPGIALQTGRMLELYREDIEVAGRIQRFVGDALQETTAIFAESAMAEIRSTIRMWMANGIPDSVVEGWKQAGLQTTAISSLERVIHPSCGCRCDGAVGEGAPGFPVEWPPSVSQALIGLVGGTLRDAQSLAGGIASLATGGSDGSTSAIAGQTERTTAIQSFVKRIETILHA